jgi:hypothetical protein
VISSYTVAVLVVQNKTREIQRLAALSSQNAAFPESRVLVVVLQGYSN